MLHIFSMQDIFLLFFYALRFQPGPIYLQDVANDTEKQQDKESDRGEVSVILSKWHQ